MKLTLEQLLAGPTADVVGIDSKLRVHSGYDSTEPFADVAPLETMWLDEEDKTKIMSRADRLALADLMLDRWTRYRAAIEALPKEEI